MGKKLRPQLAKNQIKIARARVLYKHTKEFVEQEMKTIKIALKMHLKVSKSVTETISKTEKVIKKPMEVNKANIKITTKVLTNNHGQKLIERDKKLIAKIKANKKMKKAQKQKLIAKKTKQIA